MVAVALQEQAALSGRAGGVEAGDRPITFAENAMLAIDRKPAFRMHEDRTQRPKRDIRPLAERPSVAGALII